MRAYSADRAQLTAARAEHCDLNIVDFEASSLPDADLLDPSET